MIETLFILGLIIFVGVILNSTLKELTDKADMNVYFTTNASEEQILQIKQSLEALPEVASVQYVSRDEALATFRERHQNDQLIIQALDELGENPLNAALYVRAKDISQYESIANFLTSEGAVAEGQTSIVDKVNFFDEQHRTALTTLQRINDSGGRLGLVIIIIFIVTTITTLFNMIRLTIYMSRDEIHVMRLVGAGQLFIRGPFMVEGMLQGLVAGILVLLLFYPLTWWLGSATATFFGGVNIFNYYLTHFPLFFLIMVGTGVILGAVANYLAVRRYLKI
jgi:cell division transport system permease protein